MRVRARLSRSPASHRAKISVCRTAAHRSVELAGTAKCIRKDTRIQGLRARESRISRVRETSSILAVADGRRPAGGLDRFLGEREVRDLLDRRLLCRLDVA